MDWLKWHKEHAVAIIRTLLIGEGNQEVAAVVVEGIVDKVWETAFHEGEHAGWEHAKTRVLGALEMM